MNKYFHGFLMGVSVLPALAIMPAMATVSITADTDLNEIYADGVIQDFVRSESGHVGTMTTPNISISAVRQNEEDEEDPTRYLVRADCANSVLNLGTAENPVESINLQITGSDTRAVTVWDSNSVIDLHANTIDIVAEAMGVTAWGTYGFESGTLNIEGNTVNISADEGIVGRASANVSVNAGNLNLNTDHYGIIAAQKGGVDITTSGNLIINSGGMGIYAFEKEGVVDSGGTVDIHTGNLNINAANTGILANYKKSQITIVADGDVNIVTTGKEAIHAGYGTADLTKAKADTSFLDITAKNINLTAVETGISAMSNGWIDLNGNLTVNAKNAILARGYATVNVNQSGENTVKIDGNIDFDFYSNPGSSGNSNSPIDAYVNVNLTDAQSYWTGNTLIEYYYADEPAAGVLDVNNLRLSLSNGAVWNATKITDGQTMVVDDETGLDIYSGQYYIPLNNLTIDNGTVNIADTTRGITVENANVKDATFNGGKLNIGAMTLSGGTNTFNGDVVGVDNSSSLNVGSSATMNVGTNTVNVNNITLDGTMLATLRDGDAQITAGTFDGNGTLKLSLAGAGTYHVFGDSAFRAAGIDATSSVYDISWANEDKDLVATLKSVQDIAAENGIQEDTAAAIAGAAQSTSEKLNDLAVKMQEKLAEDTVEAKQEVEKAAAAVHPEKESVAQSIAASVQTTVANLTGARMRMVAPRIGRNGGDVRLTGGGVWAQGLFNKSKQNDAFSGYTRGIAAGMDGTINKAWTIGAGYSYAHSDISGTERDTEIDSNTIFVYGQYKPTQWYVNAVLNYTMSDFSEEGVVMGTPVTGDYDVNSFGGVIATGYDFASGVTPELGLRYMHVMADDYTNSMDVKTKSKDTDFLTGVFGAKYAFGINMDRYTKLIPQLNAAVKYDMLSDRNISTVTMPGVDSYTLRGERLSRLGGEFGIGLGLKYKTVDFSINYDIDVRKDYTSQTGMLKFRYNF